MSTVEQVMDEQEQENVGAWDYNPHEILKFLLNGSMSVVCGIS